MYLLMVLWLVFNLLFPITSCITITAKPSGHVPFHGLTIFWHYSLSVAASTSHKFVQCNRKILMPINNYKLKSDETILDANGSLSDIGPPGIVVTGLCENMFNKT
jgi:hypothetical protein